MTKKQPRAFRRCVGDETSDGFFVLHDDGFYYQGAVRSRTYDHIMLLPGVFTPIAEWADAIQDPEHPPEYVMAPKSMDRPRIEYPTGVKGTRMVLEDVIAIGLASGGLTAIYERLPNQPEVLRRVWMRGAVAAKPELAPKIPVDSKGTPRPDWIGGGRWELNDRVVDFDAGTYAYAGRGPEPLVDGWQPPLGDHWTRVDAPPEPDATSEFADVYSAADAARAIADGFRLAAPNLRARPDSGALIRENEAPDTPADGYTISDVTPHPFDATAYAQRLERERREFDARVAYQTPWPQDEIDAAHARLSRIADEIARRTGR